MHELSVSSAIVDTVERHAAGRRVSVVSLRIGRMRQVVPDSLSFYFEIVSRGTVCEGARLDQELVEALLRCEDCGNEWDPAPPLEHDGIPGPIPGFRCPGCGSADSETLGGDELEVEAIEVMEEEEPCTAPR
jgi:hydrogenase nickel incorporation protein HypA/HybF